MRKSALALLSLLALAACKKEESNTSEIILKIDTMTPKMILTDSGSGVKRSWEQGDEVTVVSSSGAYAFSFKESLGSGMGAFEGPKPGNGPYDIIFPGKYKSSTEVLARSYTCQKQVGNANLSGVEVNILAEGVSDLTQVDLSSTKVSTSGILKFDVKISSDFASVSAIGLHTPDKLFYATNGKDEKTDSLYMELSEIDLSKSGRYLTAYFATSMQSVSLPKTYAIHYTIHGTSKAGKALHSRIRHELEAPLQLQGGCISTLEIGGETLNLVQYNVGSFSKTSQSNITTVSNMMKELYPDVISLNELDSCNTRHDTYQLEDFAKAMGGWKYNFAAALSYKGGKYGVGVAADPKHKLVRSLSFKLPKSDDKEVRALSIMEFEKFVFCSTHLGLTENSQAAQITEIKRIIDEYFPDVASKPLFLCGDMNALPASAAIKQLKNDWKLLSTESVTFSTNNPVKCIDYVFVLKRSLVTEVKTTYVCTSFKSGDVTKASDHFPVLVKVLLP